MHYLKGLFLLTILSITTTLFSNEKKKTDAHIIGHVTAQGEHLPFASIIIEGTTIGTATDETGHFRVLNLEEGVYTVKAQAMGYKSVLKTVEVLSGKTLELKFDLEEDLIGLEQVVVSANRNEQNRQEAMTIVTTISPQLFANTQSATLGEGLNFTPGLRLENNCQNCGFSQVRMNGMEGPYSQILINSRPIFSGLAGVYGLELFPANMIERVEVVRGGGSALYGSNAIAGTVNLITKDPMKSGFEVDASSGLIGLGYERADVASDYNINFNGSIVDLEAKAGVTVYGFVRERTPFDANGDGYSELASIKNTTVGTRAYHRTGKRGKVTVDYFNIRENRRGGNAFDKLFHEADIAEAVDHNINTGAIAFDQLFNHGDKFSLFGSVQHVDRATYYGAEQDLSAYGHTSDLSHSVGAQLYMDREKLLFFPGNFVAGIENNGGILKDKKMGYYDIDTDSHTNNTVVADQIINTTGAFVQAEWEYSQFKASVGARVDSYIVRDNESDQKDVSGTVFSPRLSFKYKLNEHISARLSYSSGFRAPQIFDEDLHIEVSGSRKVLHENDPNLKQEESRSFMGSLDLNLPMGKIQNQLLIEGFYTQLINPFANEYGDPDSLGNVIYTRVNATEGASVKGVNVEWNFAPFRKFVTKAGFTYQMSKFEEVQEFEERQFFRTPNSYGFVTIDYDFVENLCFSVSANYTGSMLVPHYGLMGIQESEFDVNNQEHVDLLAESEPIAASGDVLLYNRLEDSEQFLDLGIKFMYDIKLNGTTLQLSTGIKNIFNAYQNEFDKGVYRDPGYVYGTGAPRTIYFGVKFSNFL